MIQRKQSLYLFIAALLNAGVFYFDLYRYHIVTHSMASGMDVATSTPQQLVVSNHYPSLLIALVMTLLPLVIIFMYGNRKRQSGMSFAGILAIISFITLTLGRISHLDKLVPPPTDGSYWIGSVLPAISLVFIFLAILGIRRDEKLVKSVDRLR